MHSRYTFTFDQFLLFLLIETLTLAFLVPYSAVWETGNYKAEQIYIYTQFFACIIIMKIKENYCYDFLYYFSW